jgi:translocation and assembly module TamB
MRRNLTILSLALLLAIGAWFSAGPFAQEQTAKGLVESMLENLLASEGRSVKIDGVSISLSGDVTVLRAEVLDGSEPWLVMENMELDWQPLSLFRSKLEIDAFNIASVDLIRLPKTQEGTVSAPAEFTSLQAADIKSLNIKSFRTSSEVLGEDITVAIEGQAEIIQSPAEIRLKLEAKRIDEKAGNLRANVVFDPQTRALDLDIALDEQADGLVARQLKLQGQPATKLLLKAKGTLDTWQGTLSLALDQQEVFSGEASAGSYSEGQRILVNGSGELHRFFPPALAHVLRGTSELSASIALPATDALTEIERIRIDNPGYQLRIAGPVDPQGEGTAITFELRAKTAEEAIPAAMAEGAGITVLGLNADARINGALLSPKWSLTAQAAEIRAAMGILAKPVLAFEGEGDLTGTQPLAIKGTASGQLREGDTAFFLPALLGPVDSRLDVTLQPGGRIDIAVAEIMAGAIAGRVSGQMGPEPDRLDLNVSAETQSPDTGNAILNRLLQGNVTGEGRVTRQVAETFKLENFTVAGDAFRATANGALSSSASDLALTMALQDLAVIDDRMAGAAQGNVLLKGPWSAPEATFEAAGSRITLLGKPLDGATLSGRLKLDDQRPSGNVRFAGQLDGRDAALSADIDTLADGTRLLQNLSARANQTTLTGNLSLPPQGGPRGAFDFKSPNLADIGPFLLMELRGALNASISVEDKGSGAVLTSKFEGAGIASPEASAGAVSGEVTIADPFGQPKPVGRASLKDARIGGLRFTALDANARTTGPNTYDVSINAVGADLSGKASVSAQVSQGRTAFSVAAFDGRIRGIPVKALSPFTADRNGERLSVTGLSVAVGKGKASYSGNVLPELGGKLEIASLPLSPFALLAGVEGLDGRLTGTAQLSGKLAAPAGRFNLKDEAITFAALRAQGLSPVAVTGDGTLAPHKLTFRASGTSGPGTSFTAQGEVGIGAGRPLNVQIEGKADERIVAKRLADAGLRFRGNSQFNVRVTGTTARPAINGTATIANATLGDLAGLFIVRNARGRFEIADNLLRIASLEGATGKNGSVSASGTIRLEGDFDANLTARIRNGIYTDGALVTTRYDGDLTLTGPLLGEPVLGGEIKLEKTRVTLSSLPARPIASPDVKHVDASKAVRRQAAEIARRNAKGGGNVRLDLTLRAGDPISVSGRGLNVTLGGRLRLTGTLDNVAATGAFTLQRGSLRLLARRLDFESGRLVFEGNLDPRINLVAVSRQSDATITLTITGLASTPDIVVTSSPDMPQEEALARLIFDRSMLQLSPLQIAQIASYISTLSGGRDTGVLTGLQNALGADWVDVIQTEDGQTAISVGKRLSNRLSVGVEQTTQTNTSRVTIDLGVTKNLKLRGAYGTDGASRAGVYYENDY